MGHHATEKTQVRGACHSILKRRFVYEVDLQLYKKASPKCGKVRKELRSQKSHLPLPYQWSNICTMAATMMVNPRKSLELHQQQTSFKKYIVHHANLNI